MKKISFFLMCCCLSLSLFSQNSTLNQNPKELYEEALTLASCTPLRKELLEKATALQETEPFSVFHLNVKAALAIELDCNRTGTGEAAAVAIIALAEKKLGNDKALLAKTLMQLTQQVQQLAPQQALSYAEAALKFSENPSEDYFHFLLDEVVLLLHTLELEPTLNTYIEKTKKALKKAGYEKQYLWTFHYALEMYYYDAINEYEQAIIAAKKALTENEKQEILTNNELNGIYKRMAASFAYLKNEPESEIWIQRYIVSASSDTSDYYKAYSYYHSLAIMKAELGKLEECALFFEQAIAALKPHAADYQNDMKLLYNNLAGLYNFVGNYKAAKKYLDEVFAYGYDVSYSTTYNNILIGLKDYREGLNHVEKALRTIIKGFEPASVYENPSIETETPNNENLAVLLSEKGVFLNKLGIANKDEELLKMGLATGNLALAFTEKTDFGGLYEFSQYSRKQYLYQPITNVLLHAVAGLYELKPSKENLEQIFNYMFTFR